VSNTETNKRLDVIEKKIDLLLAGKNFDASQKLTDMPQEDKKTPVGNRQARVIKYTSAYRKRGII
jgi:hypothetical protein